MSRGRFVSVTLGAIVALHAQAALARDCAGERAPPVLSQARAARWLIGEDLRVQALVDADRRRIHHAEASLAVPEPTFRVFGATTVSVQRVGSFGVCSNRGTEDATFLRYRIGGTAGATHTPSGIHVRASFVHAIDTLQASTSDDEKSDDAIMGFQQSLVALRVGHTRWLTAVLGYVGGESSFSQTGTGNVVLGPRQRAMRAPGFFVGAAVPAAHVTAVTLVQRGTPEIVALHATDLRLAENLPISLSLGPTYIREERQAVGLLRLRGVSSGSTSAPERSTVADGEGVEEGTAMGHSRIGPLFELSAEGKDARIRHGRLRFEAESFSAFAGTISTSSLHAGAHIDGTFFRSRFFTRAVEKTRPGARGTAWGASGGAFVGWRCDSLVLSLDAMIAANRPELLSLLPSAADQVEIQGGLSIRFEN